MTDSLQRRLGDIFGTSQRKRAGSRQTFAERQASALRRAESMAAQRCPDCGALCSWHAGNVGVRATCTRCGG